MAEKQPEEFDVFICFSHKDDEVSQKFKEELKAHGIKCFHCDENFHYGATLCANILKGIELSKKMLILLSQNWVDSKFPKYEVSEFQIILITEKMVHGIIKIWTD